MEEMTTEEICQALKLTGLDSNIVGMPSYFVSIPVLSPPTNVTAAVSGSDIIITIGTAASSVDGYHYYQQIDGGTWTKLNATATTDLTYTLTPTTPGEYNFRVTSVRDEVESSPSNETTTTESMMTQVYSDTISGLRISAVDGTAFFDAGADLVAYADGNHLLEITDSGGKVLSAVIKAQGSGETVGSELVTNGTFDTDSDWVKGTGWSISAGEAHASGATDRIRQFSIITNNTLYKVAFEITSYTSGTCRPVCGNGFRAPESAVGSYVHYISSTEVNNHFDFYGVALFTGSIDNVSCKQVLSPSTSGATLVNEISGDTQNLFDVETGFAYNEASYTCTVKRILPVAEWTVDSGSLHIATVDDGAMFFHDDISFASYAGASGNTPYKFTFTDDAGKTATAWSGEAGGGKTLGDELIDTVAASAQPLWVPETLTINANGKDIDLIEVLNGEIGIAVVGKTLFDAYKLYQIDSTIAFLSGEVTLQLSLARTTDVGNPTSDPIYISQIPGSAAPTYYLTPWYYNGTSYHKTLRFGTPATASEDVTASCVWSAKQVTDIPATGLKLYSAQDGTTKSMASVETGFNPNTVVHVEISLE
jgi:hypothetical protein